MAVAHSAASESHTGTTGSANQAAFSWTHTQTGTPQGVVVFVSTYASVTDLITSVTYGGVALTRLTGGLAQDGAGESGRLDTFFLGSGLGTGNQTIQVNRTNNATVMYASAATVTAGADTAVPTGTIVLLEGDGTLTVQSVDDTSPGVDSVRYAGAYSGLNAPPGAGTGSTLLNSIDIGNYGSALVRETTAGQGARNVGFSAATDDRAVVHLAIRELVPRTETPIVGSFTLTGNAADLRHNPQIDGGTGAFTLTGNDATLSKTTVKLLDAGRGQFTLTGNPADTRHNVAITGARGQFFLPERNMRRWSESFNNAAWTKAQSSITANATTAPDGTLTADALIENTTPSTGHFVVQSITYVTGRTYTASCYFKLYPGPITRYARLQLGSAAVFAGDTYINIDLAAGTITNVPGASATYGVTSAGNGWYRAWLSAQYTGGGIATGPTIQIIATTGTGLYTDADGLSGIYIWGAQYEEGSTLTDYDPTGPVAATRTDTRVARRIDGGTGSFALTGNPADTRHNVAITGDRGAFSLTGNNATLTEATPKAIAADVGAFTLASNGATLRHSYALTAETGEFTITGQAATLRHNLRTEASAGAFALNGGSPALLRGYYLSGGAGTFIETGQPAAFRRTWAIQGGTGAFTVIGNSAALTELGAYEIDPIVGSFTLTGNDATFTQQHKVAAEKDSFVLTGNNALLTRQLLLQAGSTATNLLNFTEQLNNAYWLKTRSSISKNLIAAPDGTLTADKLIEDTTASNTHLIARSPAFTAGTTYTLSAYLKAGERQGCAIGFGGAIIGTSTLQQLYVNLTNGNIVSQAAGTTASVESVGNGWYRARLTITATVSTSAQVQARTGLSATVSTVTYTGNGTSGIYVWGFQLEAASTVGEYRPQPGHIELEGEETTLRQNPKLAGATGAFSFTGNQVTLAKQSVRQLTVEAGVFAFTGNPAGLADTDELTGQAGVFVLTSGAPSITRNRQLAADTGSIALSAGSSSLIRGYSLVVEARAVALTGNDATLHHERALVPESGTFVMVGSPINLNKTGRRRVIFIF